jgi:hypothetical protein
LSPYDLKVFQTLVGIAPVSDSTHTGHITVGPTPTTIPGEKHRESIELRLESAQKEIWVVHTTFPEFAKEMGYAPNSWRTKKIHKLIEESIEKLWGVGVLIKNNTDEPTCIASFRLASQVQIHEQNFSVCINPLAVDAILGNSSWRRHDFDVVRKIKNPTTILIHARLCQRNSPGEIHAYKMDTLVRYGYPPFPNGTEPMTLELSPLKEDPKEKKARQNLNYARRRIIRTICLPELESTGYWEFRPEKGGIYLIGRKNCPEAPSLFSVPKKKKQQRNKKTTE